MKKLCPRGRSSTMPVIKKKGEKADQKVRPISTKLHLKNQKKNVEKGRTGADETYGSKRIRTIKAVSTQTR